MAHHSEPTRADAATDRWAPWWVYVLAVVGTNYLRQAIVPPGETAVDVALFALSAVTAIAVVTVVYRLTRR